MTKTQKLLVLELVHIVVKKENRKISQQFHFT